mgnify:CR=1 FL=1
MGIVKLQNSAIPNRKEHFTFVKKKKKSKKKKKVLEVISAIILTGFIYAYTLFAMLLKLSPWTHSVELFNRFSGDHLNQLNKQIKAAKLKMSIGDNNEIPQSYETEEWKMSKLEIAEASKKSYLNIPIKHAETIKVLKKVSEFTNPIAKIAHSMFKVDKNDIFQSTRTLARLIEKDGFVNNFILEFIDWYENHSFPAVIMFCTIGMFICACVSFSMVLIGPGTSFLLKTVIFNNSPVRSMILIFFAIITNILLMILWIFLWPITLILALGSIFNIFFWSLYIPLYHYKDLLCEVERGGYIRNPMLLPYVIILRIREISNIIFDWLFVPFLRFFGLDDDFKKATGIKVQNFEIENDRDLLRIICKTLIVIYDYIWDYIIVPILIWIQILLLYYALILEVLSIVNPVTFFTRLKVKGITLKLPAFKIGKEYIWRKQEISGDWHVPHTYLVEPFDFILEYLRPSEWAMYLMDWANSISNLHPTILKGSEKFINKFYKKLISKIETILNINIKKAILKKDNPQSNDSEVSTIATSDQ